MSSLGRWDAEDIKRHRKGGISFVIVDSDLGFHDRQARKAFLRTSTPRGVAIAVPRFSVCVFFRKSEG